MSDSSVTNADSDVKSSRKKQAEPKWTEDPDVREAWLAAYEKSRVEIADKIDYLKTQCNKVRGKNKEATNDLEFWEAVSIVLRSIFQGTLNQGVETCERKLTTWCQNTGLGRTRLERLFDAMEEGRLIRRMTTHRKRDDKTWKCFEYSFRDPRTWNLKRLRPALKKKAKSELEAQEARAAAKGDPSDVLEMLPDFMASLRIGNGLWISKEELLAGFIAYSGYPGKLTANKFGRQIQPLLPRSVERRQRRVKGKPTWGYQGIGLQE